MVFIFRYMIKNLKTAILKVYPETLSDQSLLGKQRIVAKYSSSAIGTLGKAVEKIPQF
jgi:hypothetical protein